MDEWQRKVRSTNETINLMECFFFSFSIAECGRRGLQVTSTFVADEVEDVSITDVRFHKLHCIND